MKAITIWQPWASLVAIGAKKYETRSWATSYRGPIAIHAAKKAPTYTAATGFINRILDALKMPNIDYLPRGAVVATAELVECWEISKVLRDLPSEEISAELTSKGHGSLCVHHLEREVILGDWTPGRYAWELTNVQMLSEPIPAKGMQRLWTVALPHK